MFILKGKLLFQPHFQDLSSPERKESGNEIATILDFFFSLKAFSKNLTNLDILAKFEITVRTVPDHCHSILERFQTEQQQVYNSCALLAARPDIWPLVNNYVRYFTDYIG